MFWLIVCVVIVTVIALAVIFLTKKEEFIELTGGKCKSCQQKYKGLYAAGYIKDPLEREGRQHEGRV